MGKKSKSKRLKKAAQNKSQEVRKNHSKYFCWGILFFVIALSAFIRIRLLSIPLERDEGEFAYMGQLMLQGIPPYLMAYNMKLPGIYAAYALLMGIFGQSIEGIHLGFIVINAATTVVVFLLAKRLFDAYTGLIASTSYAILSLSPTVLGTSAHATHFVLLPALGGIYWMVKALDSGKWKYLLWSGLCLGLSFFMKQPGVFFTVFGFLYLLFRLIRRHRSSFKLVAKKGALYGVGAILPFALTCGVLLLTGVFEKFWFWTFSYASQYGSRIPLSLGLEIFFNEIPRVIGKLYLFWGIASLGIVALFWDKVARMRMAFVLGFLFFSFIAVCPGLYFRGHYFVLLLPAVSLLIGIALSSLKRLFQSREPQWQFIPSILFIAVFLFSVFQYQSFFFELTPSQACRLMYGPNPFPESVEISKYIRNHSKEGDKIAILGSEPQIYFYSGRHSATGHIYTYALMEDQKYALQMQKEMIEEIEKALPEFLVFVNISTSWLVRPKSETYIFKWFEEYSKKNLNLVGVIDILSEIQTGYRWDSEATNYSPRSPYFLYVYKRKNT